MRNFIPFTFILICFFPPSTIAAPLVRRQMSISQASATDGAISLVSVSPSQALTISFIKTGQTIKKVWLGNPSKIVMDFDSPLCREASKDSNSTNTNCGASVIYLRQLAKPLNIEMNLPNSARGNLTSLTIITTSDQARYLYQFQLALNQPLVYSVLDIVNDSQIPRLTSLLQPKVNDSQIPKLTPLLQPKCKPLSDSQTNTAFIAQDCGLKTLGTGTNP